MCIPSNVNFAERSASHKRALPHLAALTRLLPIRIPGPSPTCIVRHNNRSSQLVTLPYFGSAERVARLHALPTSDIHSSATGPNANDALSALASQTIASPVISTFEPQFPDGSILASQAVVLLLTVSTAAYWWLVVVPSERAALGRSKRLGALETYLGKLELPEAVMRRRLERWFYTDWLRQREERRARRQQRQQLETSDDKHSRDATTSVGTASKMEGNDTSEDDVYDRIDQSADDNLLRPAAATPSPRFFSLDNPIVATFALLLLAAVLAGGQQR